MRRSSLVLVGVLLLLAAGCRQSGSERSARSAATVPPADTTSGSYLQVPGGKIWYRVVGAGDGTPVILLHGGPGLPSNYLESLEALGDDRVVVRYDQLGGGKSDHVSDTTMFTIPHFVAELDSLRSHLGLERVDLYGHSWGAILALEYYRAHPEHVKSLVLASAALDIPAWQRNGRRLLATLPDSMQRAVEVADSTQGYDAPAYQAAVGEFSGRYVFLRPVQAELDSAVASMGEAVSSHMHGPSEFAVTGTLKNYDATGFLPQVKVPVLYTVGSVDEADTATVRGFAKLTPGARMVVIPNAAHITMWDNPRANTEAVRTFLRYVDSGGGGQ